MQDIVYINRENRQKEVEKVYGDAFVRWMYETYIGSLIGHLACRKPISMLYGAYQDLGLSKSKIGPFIEKFNIPMEQFLPSEGRSNDDPYGSFNEFFTRKVKPEFRPFAKDLALPAPADARYVAFNSITSDQSFPVKGEFLNYCDLLQNEQRAKVFDGGPLCIARLCPVDYHRYHFPDDGKYLDFYEIAGRLHSVNPIALKAMPEIFITNERHVSILDTKTFGKLAYIEVGATCVGKIKQTHPMDKNFSRGDEKGLFLFGGSTVILIGEKGKWSFDEDIIENTKNGFETYIKLGAQVGSVK